jgi:hypothetical protein
LQCGLTFRSDFSPQAWECCRRIAEQLSQKLFDDDTLVSKHAKYLENLRWGKRLGKDFAIVPAHACIKHKGVLDDTGRPINTPHYYFVDDGLLAEVYDRDRILRALAADIEGLFIILGHSDLTKRQDPISWDKLLEMLINYSNIALGLHVNTRKMVVSPSASYLAETINLLGHWHSGRKSFTIPEMEPLVGKLNHLAITVPWLLHLMGHLYVSLTAALTDSQKHLVHTSKAFRQLLKLIKHNPDSPEEQQISTFAQGETARRIHKSKKKYILLPTAKEELRIIRTALLDNSIIKYSPIAHHVDHTPNGTAGGDSCLRACGGYSIDMEYWWYLEWPPEILNSTLLFIKNNKNGDLVAINGLEYATQLSSTTPPRYTIGVSRTCVLQKTYLTPQFSS